MPNAYKKMFSPLRIGNVILKNRLCYPNASLHCLQGPETFPADSFIAHVSGLAKSGAALVVVADWDNYPAQRMPGAMEDFVHMQAFDMKDPSVHNYFSALAADVHMYGSKLLVSTKMPMPQGYALNRVHRPSMLTGKMEELEALPAERMEEAIELYVKKISLYKSLGYDGLNIRADSFLLPAENERTDDYGGSVQNRTRLLLDALRRVKQTLGSDFIIEVAVHGEQPIGYGPGAVTGYSHEDFLEFAKLSEGVVDILQLREKNAALAHPLPFNSKKHVYPTIEYARSARAAGVKTLLSVNGGYQDPDDIERYLEEGVIDLVSMARTFLCEPHYEEKVREGRVAEITPCLRCNLCHGNFRPPWISVCSVNPEIGIQHKLDRFVQPARRHKKVAVIGGGPAGMKAAIVAAERGHDVTLYEKSDYLGGLLVHAEYFTFKWTLKDFRDWLVRELERVGVKVVMNTAPAPEALTAAGFDTVLAALGSTPRLPTNIAGLRDESGRPLYPTCYDVFGKEAELGQKVVIVGGSETGVETAMYLAENGHEVTVLTRQDEIAYDASHLHYITMCDLVRGEDGRSRMISAWEKYDGLDWIVNATTTKVEGRSVVYLDREGAEHTIEADNIVICGGVIPNAEVAMAYGSCTDEFYAVGDCAGAGNIQRCMRDAWGKANRV